MPLRLCSLYMKILITGGSGFIGKRFIQLLSSKNIPYKTLGRNVKDDIFCDFETDAPTIDAFKGIDCLVHIAGYAHDTKRNEDSDAKHNLINFRLTEDLLKLSDQNNLKKFIFISSVKAGGQQKINGRIVEESEQYGDGSYARAKRASEKSILNFLPNNHIDKIIIRPSLVYGKGMKGNLELMFRYMKKGIFPPLPHTKSRKALIHVDDLARAILFLIEKENLNNEIFCVTDECLYSPKDIYDSLSIAIGKPVKRWFLPFTIFRIIALFPFFKGISKKLFSDEPYSSKKISSLGFKPLLKLRQINEEIF